MLAFMVNGKNGTHMIEKYFEKEALKRWLLHTIFFVVLFDGLHIPLLAPGFGETIV